MRRDKSVVFGDLVKIRLMLFHVGERVLLIKEQRPRRVREKWGGGGEETSGSPPPLMHGPSVPVTFSVPSSAVGPRPV